LAVAGCAQDTCHSAHSSFGCPGTQTESLHGFGSPPEEPTSPGRRIGLLSWDSSLPEVPGKPGFEQLPPLHRHVTERHPLWSLRTKGSKQPALNCSTLVVLHHFDGFLRSEDAGLLHPAADHGVRRVSELWEPGPRTKRARDCVSTARGGQESSPRRESHPSKNSPLQKPHCVTTTVASLPF
jgi:hypothetical protein